MIPVQALSFSSTVQASLNIGGATKKLILAASISCVASQARETPVITFTDILP